MSYDKLDQTKIKPHQKNNQYTNREKRPPRKITETYLHNAGLYYLERFSASAAHFKSVMLRKVKRSCHYHIEQDYTLCAVMVDDLVEKFVRAGLLDDAAYTSALVTSLRRKGLSRTAILCKMYIKGIAQEQSMQALETLDDAQHENADRAEKNAALKLARKKKLGPYFIGEKDAQNMQKALGVFARAGFSYSLSRSVLEMEEGCDFNSQA